jgi:hypothetical protein
MRTGPTRHADRDAAGSGGIRLAFGWLSAVPARSRPRGRPGTRQRLRIASSSTKTARHDASSMHVLTRRGGCPVAARPQPARGSRGPNPRGVVHAGERPEVDNDDVTLQLGGAEWLGVEPLTREAAVSAFGMRSRSVATGSRWRVRSSCRRRSGSTRSAISSILRSRIVKTAIANARAFKAGSTAACRSPALTIGV